MTYLARPQIELDNDLRSNKLLLMFDFDILKSVTIPQLLKRVCELYGPKPAFFGYRNESWSSVSYSDLEQGAEAIANGLLALGLSRSSKIAILSENSPEWCLAYLGILSMGGTVVPVDPQLKANELKVILPHSESESIFVSSKCLVKLMELGRSGLSFKKVILLDQTDSASSQFNLTDLMEKGRGSAQRLPVISNLDLAVLIYTSGTTGNPKGVMLTHKNILSDIWGIFQVLGLFPTDKFLSVMPLHHTFEATCGFLVPLCGGGSVVYSRSLKSKALLEDMMTHQITVMLGVPLLFEKFWLGLVRNIQSQSALGKLYFGLGFGLGSWLPKGMRYRWGTIYFSALRKKAGLDWIRLLICGGAPLPPEIAKNFDILGIKFLQGYGLTETAPVLTLNPKRGYKYASLGLPIGGAELKIHNPNSQGIGEILAKGEMIMAGYYRNPRATAIVLKEGWFHTGDSGWKDKKGFFYIAGRLKNVIVTRAGKNVYPEEIEKELVKSPYIAEALVIGRRIQGGEEVFAIIVPDYDYIGQVASTTKQEYDDQKIEELIKIEISSYCQNLADYKRIKGFQIHREELEKTSTRKIKRFLFSRPQVQPDQKEVGPRQKEVKV